MFVKFFAWKDALFAPTGIGKKSLTSRGFRHPCPACHQIDLPKPAKRSPRAVTPSRIFTEFFQYFLFLVVFLIYCLFFRADPT